MTTRTTPFQVTPTSGDLGRGCHRVTASSSPCSMLGRHPSASPALAGSCEVRMTHFAASAESAQRDLWRPPKSRSDRRALRSRRPRVGQVDRWGQGGETRAGFFISRVLAWSLLASPPSGGSGGRAAGVLQRRRGRAAKARPPPGSCLPSTGCSCFPSTGCSRPTPGPEGSGSAGRRQPCPSS